MIKTLGGDRIGAGKKMKVELKNYERSTFDLGYIFRSTMSIGTLVPFLVEVALPGDTFDINLNAIAKTLPTVGPLFGSAKVQLDIFKCPIRLYNSYLHNNQLGIGMNMSQILLPQLQLTAPPTHSSPNILSMDLDNSQINPSCVLAYLGIRGIGSCTANANRRFNAVPLLAYWDIYKNYYANKMEGIGAVINTPMAAPFTVTAVNIWPANATAGLLLAVHPGVTPYNLGPGTTIRISATGVNADVLQQVQIRTTRGWFNVRDLSTGDGALSATGVWSATYDYGKWGLMGCVSWKNRDNTDSATLVPKVLTFPLGDIDKMRNILLKQDGDVQFMVTDQDLFPYKLLTQKTANNTIPNILCTQEGLALKTFQSDIFNNWLETDWIDGANGISAVTKVSTTSGGFTIDALTIAKKVYDMLNRIAVAGGSYDDWLDAVYTEERYTRASTPVYCGGLSKELVFQEVVATAEGDGNPLGSLAGRGHMTDKHKGGYVTVKIDEPCYIMGLVSITPRLDYSQGNRWDVNLKNMDNFHKPALDAIGFQELITENMAWWDTYHVTDLTWQQRSAGKQPAWLHYMTNYNRCYGNFAVANNSMFMTFNRRYEAKLESNTISIKDLTTYIDPAKFNFIFAQTNIDAQNYWMQIGVDMQVRRKMSSKLIPNL